jgi:hypothetical protein
MLLKGFMDLIALPPGTASQPGTMAHHVLRTLQRAGVDRALALLVPRLGEYGKTTPVKDLAVRLRQRAADHLYRRGPDAVHYADEPGEAAPSAAPALGAGSEPVKPKVTQPTPPSPAKLPQGPRGLEMVGPDAYVLYHQSREPRKLLTGGRFEPGEPGEAISLGRPATASLRKSLRKHGTSAEFQAS